MYAYNYDNGLASSASHYPESYEEIKVRAITPANQDETHLGELVIGDKVFPCAIGEAGIVEDQRDGGPTTPSGRYNLRRLYYRYDKLQHPVYSQMPLMAMLEDDGWCDDVEDKAYNKAVMLPYHASAERLWREDDLYDLVIVLGVNDDPAIAGKGNTIFIHVANEGDLSKSFKATKGCVALRKDDLLQLLPHLSEETVIDIAC